MTIEKILNNLLRGGPVRPAADYRAAAAGIDLAALEATVEACQARRQAMLLRGSDAEIERSEADVRNAQREVDKGRAAKAELERLSKNAEELEKAATIDTTAAAARRLLRELLEQMLAFDEAATGLAEMRRGMEGTTRQIEAANETLAKHGHGDLRVLLPNQMLDKQGVSQSDMPRLNEWLMPGYYPLPQRLVCARPAARPFALAQRLLNEVSRG